jgi:hypothetical protein
MLKLRLKVRGIGGIKMMRSEIADIVVSAMKLARRFRQVEGMLGSQIAGTRMYQHDTWVGVSD